MRLPTHPGEGRWNGRIRCKTISILIKRRKEEEQQDKGKEIHPTIKIFIPQDRVNQNAFHGIDTLGSGAMNQCIFG